MDVKKIVGGILKFASDNSPAIFTGLGIAGFGTTVVMTARVASRVEQTHKRYRWDRDDILMDQSLPEEKRKSYLKDTYVEEAKELAPLCCPVAAVGAISVGCVLMAHKIHADRQAAIMTAYSLSTDALNRYQAKVIEKLGEEVHQDILDSSTKEFVHNSTPTDGYKESTVIPEGTVRCYDAVTGRYFFSNREKILEAESEVNKRLINQVSVPLQDFYYEMGLEESFVFGKKAGWDISSPYYEGGNLDVYFTPMLDDDKNPCLVLNYHVIMLDRKL